MNVGFIGLGHMGKPMAMNMHKSGCRLTVFDIRSHLLPAFEAAGIRTAACLSDFAACDVVFLCLQDTETVRGLLFGEDGLAAQMKPKSIICDFSTIHYTASVEFAAALAEMDLAFMDAPVSGMEARAIDATLTVMCGGSKEVFDTLMPLFRCVGTNILFMGDHGSGQLAKAINNILFDINIAAFAEILPVAVKLGLDPATIGTVINTGSGRSYASEFFIPRILKGNFGDGYPLKLAYKDLVSGAELSAKLGAPLPLMHAATTTYQMALLKGLGDQDKGAMIKVFEELLGVEVRSK